MVPIAKIWGLAHGLTMLMDVGGPVSENDKYIMKFLSCPKIGSHLSKICTLNKTEVYEMPEDSRDISTHIIWCYIFAQFNDCPVKSGIIL